MFQKRTKNSGSFYYCTINTRICDLCMCIRFVQNLKYLQLFLVCVLMSTVHNIRHYNEIRGVLFNIFGFLSRNEFETITAAEPAVFAKTQQCDNSSL